MPDNVSILVAIQISLRKKKKKKEKTAVLAGIAGKLKIGLVFGRSGSRDIIETVRALSLFNSWFASL